MQLSSATALPAQGAVAAAWSEVLTTTDIDAHALAQGGWQLRYEQLSEGAFHGRLHRVTLPGLTLLREDTRPAVRQRGRLSPEAYGFAMPLADGPDLFFNGQRVPAHAVMCGRGDDIDMITPADFTLMAIVAERSLLEPLWERMYHKPLAAWLERQLVLRTTAVKADALRALHLTALDQAGALALRQPEAQTLRQLRDEILIEWIEALPAQVDTRGLDTLQRRKRLVDQACELMLARSDEPLSILEVCSQVGISRRKLNYCFHDVLGTTPVKYLRAVRLNGVRRDLKRAAPAQTVQDIATRWGFWHLSQFAQDYRRLFGELPSATLKGPR
jgi:AraC family transcriptional regulator, ethanolamine operon transcriptional activator